MKVQRPAALVLGDLHVGDAHAPAQLAVREAGQARELARDLDRRPPPQLRRQRVPQHRVLVVEAVRAQRLAQPRVVLVVDLAARQPHPVRAHVRRAARGRQRCARPPANRRECTGPKLGAVSVTNTIGCSAHRLRHALAAAQPGGDELVRVAAVGLRARRADRLAAIAAALQQRASGSGLGRVDRARLAGRQVDRVDLAAQPHRLPAVARRAHLVLEALPLLRVRCPRQHLLEHRTAGCSTVAVAVAVIARRRVAGGNLTRRPPQIRT